MKQCRCSSHFKTAFFEQDTLRHSDGLVFLGPKSFSCSGSHSPGQTFERGLVNIFAAIDFGQSALERTVHTCIIYIYNVIYIYIHMKKVYT